MKFSTLPFAAGLSIFVSLVSALSVIGLPVEVYRFGDGMFWRIPGGLIGTLVLSFTFVPLFHKLRAYSIYSFYIHQSVPYVPGPLCTQRSLMYPKILPNVFRAIGPLCTQKNYLSRNFLDFGVYLTKIKSEKGVRAPNR